VAHAMPVATPLWPRSRGWKDSRTSRGAATPSAPSCFGASAAAGWLAIRRS
jgi:hypothetical protein